jgi:hypothetical protein
LAVASTNACDSGSSTTGGCVVMDMCRFSFGLSWLV